jgi:integrase
MKFSSLVELYLTDLKTRLRPTSYDVVENVVNKHILPYFKDMNLNTITPAIIRKWQNTLIDETFKQHKMITEKKYKPIYLRNTNCRLSAIFNYACKYYHVQSNPVRLCGPIGNRKPETIQFWTLDEFNKFITVFKDNIQYKTIFSLLFWTGCRVGELLALTLADFDFDNLTMNIDKSYKRIHKQDLIQPPKTAKSKRVIILPQFLVDIVKEYISTLYELQPHQRLFELTIPAIRFKLIKAAKIAGVKKIRVHDLRHSHASLLIEQGFSPLVIKERLGHENIETTLQTYSHLYPTKQNELADKLQLLGTGKKKNNKK